MGGEGGPERCCVSANTSPLLTHMPACSLEGALPVRKNFSSHRSNASRRHCGVEAWRAAADSVSRQSPQRGILAKNSQHRSRQDRGQLPMQGWCGAFYTPVLDAWMRHNPNGHC